MSFTQPDPAKCDNDFTVEASFALLESCLERLAERAPLASADEILELIPSVPIASQRLIMVELIKADLAAAAEEGSMRSLEFYWPTAESILPRDAVPFDLVLEEIHLRRSAGEVPELDEYRQRFPDMAETIGKWLAGGETESGTPPPSKLPELDINATVDDFDVLKQLGQGAFARVYLARQNSMQRLVALKVSSRGSEEPQALSQLDHPNIVRVYDQRTITEPPAILLYMQYVPGGTLADCIKFARECPAEQRSGKLLLDSIDRNLVSAGQSIPESSATRASVGELTWPEAVAWIGIQLAEGLDYASTKQVLHRDVKPANILLSAEAIPKLADFNVSFSGLSGRAGAAAYFGGSLGYMSSEQLRVADALDPMTAERLDVRSDLSSLGIVLWELWQGQRPWILSEFPANWTQAIEFQGQLRTQAFLPLRPAQTATERVLEKVLRSLLDADPDMRPGSGTEVAARLRLALHPELAMRFQPPPKSLPGQLLSWPVLLLSLIIIFGPNTAASIFNYFYNLDRMEALEEEIPGVLSSFKVVANWVNGIAYPLGAALFFWIALPFAKIVHDGKAGLAMDPQRISALWKIGNKATLICGILWSVSGAVFAISLAIMHKEFGGDDALHFFLSLILCGGVAWIYPYFGMTLLSLLIYYPTVVEPTMQDASFSTRSDRVRLHSRWYLASAAAVPLTAVAALVFRDNLPRSLILVGVAVTAIGLAASFFAQQKIDETLRQFSQVLGSQAESSRLPSHTPIASR